jgi:epoxyqueuosine reductase
VFEERLAALATEIQSLLPGTEARPCVDYGPIMERDHAQRAGLGWIGKNTMLIHPSLGSWLLLGELLTTAEIPPDDAFDADRCGTCERCVVECPTAAITPRRVDSRLCISYLTIELQGPIPVPLRAAIGNRVFGCDICQEVCPWNDGVSPSDPAPFRLGRPVHSTAMASWAEELLDLSEAEFRSRYVDTPLRRPGREGLLRNLCVGLGNSGAEAAVPVLMRCLDESSPLVREHAAWALGRLSEIRVDRSAGTPRRCAEPD